MAGRRFIAALDALYRIDRVGPARKLRRSVKKRLRLMSALRDIHIQIEYVKDLSVFHPQLRAFLDPLAVRADKMEKRVAKKLKRVATGKLEKKVRILKKRMRKWKADPRESLPPGFAEAQKAFARMESRRLALNPSDARTLHRFRIAFKRFRYLVEFLEPLLPGIKREEVKRMGEFQKKLGEIQDIGIVLDGLKDFRPEAGAGKAVLRQVRDRLFRRREELVRGVMDSVDPVLRFWRDGLAKAALLHRVKEE